MIFTIPKSFCIYAKKTMINNHYVSIYNIEAFHSNLSPFPSKMFFTLFSTFFFEDE